MVGGRNRVKFAWKHVAELDAGRRWKCNYCGDEYGGGALRIKKHLAGSGDISKCDAVPKDIEDEARRKLVHGKSSSPKMACFQQAEREKGKGKRKLEDCDGVDVANPSEETVERNSSDMAPPVQIPSKKTTTTPLQVSPSFFFSNDECLEWDRMYDTDTIHGWSYQDPVGDMSDANLGNPSAEQEISNNTNDVAPTSISNSLGTIPSSLTTSANHGGLDFTKNSQDVTIPIRDAPPSSRFSGSYNATELEANIASTSMGMASASSEKCGQSPTLKSVVPCSSQNDQDHHKEEENSMSWNATGCTLMVYNLNQQNEGEKSKRTLGFYSPKGFLFAKAPDVLSIEKIRDVFRDLTSSSYKGTVMHFMGHDKYDWFPTDQVCDLSDHESIGNWTDDPGFCQKKCSCLGHLIKRSCLEICKESAWAWDLINKGEEIHQLIGKLNSLNWYYQTSERRGFKELASGEIENSLSRFLSIIRLEVDLKKLLSRRSKSRGIPSTTLTDIQATLNNSEFWEDGRELKGALSPILKIPYLMDTLVPASGYLEMYMKEANQIIINRRDAQRLKKDEFFWHRLNIYLVGIDNIARRRPVATYMNPAYVWDGDAQTILELKRTVEARLPNLVGSTEFADIEKELELYSDKSSSPFTSTFITLKSHHPLKLWQQHGHALPHLRNFAIQELSQPVSCMSNQVKKHMYECEAAEGDILQNLNRRTRDEFRNMGDDIYKPIDLKELYEEGEFGCL